MSQQKVGELFAELRIDDLTPGQMRRAERNFDTSVRRMRSVRDPDIGVDTSSIAPDLDRAERKVRSLGDIDADIRPEADLSSLEGADGDVGGAIRGWATAAVAAAAAVGILAGKALVDNFMDWAERDKETDRLGAALGLSEADSDRLGKLAGGIYADAWGDSVADVTRTLQFGNVEGLFDLSSTDAEIETVTTRILDLAGVFEQDVAGIARSAGTMLRTGVAQDVWEALDILATGFQNGTNKADDLLDTFNEYSTIFRALGIDGQTALGMLGQGLEAGARDSDYLADALKEFAIRGQDGSDAVGDAFKILGLDAGKMGADIAAGGDRAREALSRVLDRLRGMKDPVDRNAAAVGLFGTKAEDLQEALYAMDTDTAQQELEDLAGTAERVSEQANDNVATTIEAMQRRVKAGVEDWLGGLWEAYESEGWDGVAEALGEDIERLGELWDEHGPAILDGLGEWLDEYGLPIATDLFMTLGQAAVEAWLAEFNPVAIGQRLGQFFTELGEELVPHLEDLGVDIAEVLGGVWDVLPEAMRLALNEMIDLWNALEFTLPEVDTRIPGVGKIGGFTISTPNLPHFDVGGTIPGARGAAMLAMVHGGEVVYNGPQQEAMGRQMAALEAGQRALAAAVSGRSVSGGGRTIVYTARPERIARDLLWERAS